MEKLDFAMTDEEITSERAIFEEWASTQFGFKQDYSLDWDADGYGDNIINGMWIGFAAGRILKFRT